jgi:hypothetical protein
VDDWGDWRRDPAQRNAAEDAAYVRRMREAVEGQPCTPRCADMHALDCPNYRGPLSATGSLAKRDPREIAREGDW